MKSGKDLGFHHPADIKEQIDFFSVNCSAEYDPVRWTDENVPTKRLRRLSLLRPPRRVSLKRVVFPLCCWASPIESVFLMLPFLLICLLFCLMIPQPPLLFFLLSPHLFSILVLRLPGKLIPTTFPFSGERMRQNDWTLFLWRRLSLCLFL